MWVNNIAAYNAHYTTDVSASKVFCGTIMREHYDKISVVFACQSYAFQQTVWPLCEVSTFREDKQPRKVRLTYPGNRNFPVLLVMCDSTQFTLSFLPCDSSSGDAFLSSDVSSGFPHRFVHHDVPLFQCSKSVQYVSYTFLCDHRKDCADNSDEDFCQFPPCSGNTPLQCETTNQVILSLYYIK